MSKVYQISIRTTDEIKTILEQQAAQNHRSMAGQVEYLILRQEREDKNMTTVINASGVKIEFNAAVNLMDDGIREDLHRIGYATEQDFFAAYEKAHKAKFGADWELSKSNPVW
ncbi:MAG: hypothetical protein Q8873_00610 [Bacillota bacterium]|nr:hypothetical protein [Bacillota bacterium]